MPNAMQDWLGEFVGRKEFVGKYRYYAAVLGKLVPVEDRGVPVMAVSAFRSQFYLHVNVDYFFRPDHF